MFCTLVLLPEADCACVNDRDRRAWDNRALLPTDADLLLDTLRRGPVCFTPRMEPDWRFFDKRRD